MLNIDRKVYDIIGVGIGPFNLGMAVMAAEVPQLNCIFFDQAPAFNWHAGMMLPNARLQVPFYADLVTLIEPCSRYSYLKYQRSIGKMYKFFYGEHHYIRRAEYNEYCQWVVRQLENLHFNHKVVAVHYDVKQDIYAVTVHHLSSDELLCYYGKHLVIGVGSVPNVPECARKYFRCPGSSPRDPRQTDTKNARQPDHTTKVIHSSDYLFYKDAILEHSKISVVGSGQSAAEIFGDLLDYADHLESLCWYTRGHRFYPMETNKLCSEMTSPDYIDHFHGLSKEQKIRTLKRLDPLYKGINYSLINDIYDTIDNLSRIMDTGFIRMHTNAELQDVRHLEDGNLGLQFYHTEVEKHFERNTSFLILATGYETRLPSFLDSLDAQVNQAEEGKYQVNRNYSVDNNNSIFVQNAELHTHGFSAPDLGMGPYRNATILNAILGDEYFLLEKNVTFQTFGIER